MISKGILKRLIELGCREDIDKPGIATTFSDLKDKDEINRRWRGDWEEAAGLIFTSEIVSLLKGLTIAEERFRWSGGSVSAAIWVYKALERRDAALAKEAADWVVRRSSNSWLINVLPYDIRIRASIPNETRTKLDRLSAAERGKWYQDFVRSRREAEARSLEEKKIRRERILAIEREKQEARGKKRQKRLARPPAPIKDVDEWRKIIENVGKDGAQARLATIASHPEIPLNFFPKEWGDVDQDLLKRLGGETRELLLKRLKGRRGEPWRRIFQCLGGV